MAQGRIEWIDGSAPPPFYPRPHTGVK